MQWAAGWYASERTQLVPPTPRSHQIWSDEEDSVWAVGALASRTRSVMSSRSEARLVIIGECLATDTELLRVLDNSTSNMIDFAQWPGAYIVCVQRPQETIVFGDLAGRHQAVFHAICRGICVGK